jgi:hypothetical protein
MRDTVAIIGSHPRTREQFSWERDDCDIWVFNEVMHAAWCKRADAVFQMHKPVIWRSTQNRNDPHHYDWLKSGLTPTIFMMEKYPDVPKSEAYPLEAVRAEFPRCYFTSSVSYAIALAIYWRFKRIEIYGVEMETQTEYGHQREGVAYWIGVGEGRGIEIDFRSSSMLKSPLYGYEGDIKLPIDFYEGRVDAITKPREDLLAAYEKAKGEVHAELDLFEKNFKHDITGFDEKIRVMGQAAFDFSVTDGISQLHNLFLAKAHKMESEVGSYMIVRQEYDDIVRNNQKALSTLLPAITVESTKLEGLRDQFDKATNKDVRHQLVLQFKEQLGRYVKKINMSGVLNGSGLECRGIMSKLDELIRMAGGSKAEEIMQEAMSETLLSDR